MSEAATGVLPALPSVPTVHIEDQGPPDEWGRVEALVRFDGDLVARLQYAAWPEHLVIYETTFEPHAPPDAGVHILITLLRLYPDDTPQRLTHSAIHEPATVAWYQRSHLAPGVLVSGSWGVRTLFYDPVRVLDPHDPPEPLLEGYPSLTLTLMYVANLRDWGEVRHPTLDDVWTWLVDGDPLGRFAAIRRLALDPEVDREVARNALYLALLNENAGVRQFAAIHLGGFFPELQIRADVDTLHALLADPLVVWQRFGRDPHPDVAEWNIAQCRRNARYAIAWALGNICWNAQGWGAVDWAEEEAEAVRALLLPSLDRFTDERDRWLYQLALNEFSDDPAARFGLGVPEPVDLFDFLRFAILRWGIVTRLGLHPSDRFYWLTTTADGILGKAPSGDDDDPWNPLSPAAARLYAPPPLDALPDVQTMPPWLAGQNHYELYAPVEIEPA